MRYRLRTLMVLLASIALTGCDPGRSKVEIIQDGAENVDQHAKEIEQAAETQP